MLRRLPRAPSALFILAALAATVPAGAAHPAGAPQDALWGDANCSGAVDTIDALAGLRSVAALPVAQTEPCPDIGAPAEVTDPAGTAARTWGDHNCSGAADSVDALAALRFAAALPVNQTEPCPDIGSPVQVEEAPSALWYVARGGPQVDEAWGVDTDASGNVYWATHQTVPGPWPDMIVYKLAPDGRQLWETRWGGPWAEEAFIVVVDEPRIYVAGFTQHAGSLHATDMAVIALDASDGSLVWDFTWDQGFGYEEADGLVVDGDSIYIAGWTTGDGTQNDIAVLKLDLQGGLGWAKTWGTPGWDEANGQIHVDENAIYVAGRYNTPNALFFGDALLVSFSKQTGDLIDFTTWGDNVFDDALGLTSDGGYLYVVGSAGDQIFLRKHGTDLSLAWEAEWGGSGSEVSRVVEIDSLGVLVASKTDSAGAGEDDLALLRFDRDGNLLWESFWGGAASDVSHGLAIHGTVAYIAAETESYGAGKLDALLVNVNAETGQFPEP